MIEALSGRRVLLTGGAGFIGSAVGALVRQAPCHLRVLAHSQRPLVDGGPAAVEVLEGDVRDRELMMRALDGVDIVFHLAAQTSTGVSDDDPEVDRRVNVDPVVTMLEACRRNGWHPTIVLAGAETQVGIPSEVPTDPAAPDCPETVYDLHKLVAEHYLELYVRRGLVHGTCLRLPPVYGPGPNVSAPERGVLNGMIRRGLRGEPLTVYGDGEWLRDFVHVDDVAAAFVCAGLHPEEVNGRHLMVGTGVGHTVAHAISLVASTIERSTGRKVPVVSVPAPPGLQAIDRRNYVADISGLTSATGWRPRYHLREGIAQTVAFHLREGSGR